jgi:hypothetical protein
MAHEDHDSEELKFGNVGWAQVIKLRVELRYLSSAIQKLENHVKEALVAQEVKFGEQEKRIRILENFRWWMVGAMIGSGIITAVLQKLMEKL